MNDNEQKTFETVDLLKPVEMIPIEGMDSPLIPLNDTSGISKTVSEPETGSSENDLRDKALRDTVLHEDAAFREDSGFHKDTAVHDDAAFYEDNAFHGENAGMNGEIHIDPKVIFSGGDAFRNRKAEELRKRNARVIGIVVFFACFIMMFSIMRSINRRFEDRNYDTYNNERKSVMLQEDVYGTIEFNTDGSLNTELALFNTKLIEFTNSFERKLFFRVSPRQENVGINISVEMIDGYGNSLGVCSGSVEGVPIGHTGIVTVAFDVSPFDDLGDITYKISADTFKTNDDTVNRLITKSVFDGDRNIHVYMEGKDYNKYVNVVFFKNENVVSVLYRYVLDGSESAVIDIDTQGIDFDRFELNY